MICELCTIDTVLGTVWRTPPVRSGSTFFQSGFVICSECKSAVLKMRPETVDDRRDMNLDEKDLK